MFYLLPALLLGFVSALPAFLSRSMRGMGVLLAVAYTLVLWYVMYVNASGFVGPMFSGYLIAVAVFASITLIIAILTDHHSSVGLGSIALPVSLWLIIGFVFVSSWGIFNASDYRALVGQMEDRVWTQDIQPKDPEHVRQVSAENALYLARKVVGELGTVGSQFQVDDRVLAPQLINKELWYVVPLDFSGWRAWSNAGTVIGYIMISAEDPNRQPVVKQLPKEEQFVYTAGAWFGDNLERHIRLSGNLLSSDIVATHLELDDSDKAWWVTTLTKPTIGQFGDKIFGVALTNPVTGEIVTYDPGEVPSWVDRVMPQGLIYSYLNDWGKYVHGGWNYLFGSRDITEAENSSLVYGAGGEAVWVSGITSTNNEDDSLIGVVYTNTHTGKSVFYQVKGGGTDTSVLSAVDKSQDVQFKKLHGTDPQIYNILGTMADIVPLVNENHAYSGVAIVNVNNVQQVAVGRNLAEAIRQYESTVTQSGNFASLGTGRKVLEIDGVVSRVGQECIQSGSTFYLVVSGSTHAFIGDTTEFPALPLVRIGDKMHIGYYESGDAIVPIRSLKNTSLVLAESATEEKVVVRAEESRDENEAKASRITVEERMKNASPEDLKKIEEALGK